jgi:hypothetical protein
MMRTLFVALISLGLAPSAAWAGCEKDTDCKGDRICENTICVNPPAAPPPADPGPADAKARETAEAAAPPPPTDPDGWWKKAAREAEVPVLQELFNEAPRPIRKKGGATLVYQRAVPLVVADIHDTTRVWGAKLQSNVHFLGISKVHTTTTLSPIGPETGGIPYCPLNCARITDVYVRDGDEISILYDGPIKDWAGKAADNASGYVRKIGKQYREMCSFPLAMNHAPSNAWLDPAEVKKVSSAIVTEIKRYCGK